jgi:hypothetical protein
MTARKPVRCYRCTVDCTPTCIDDACRGCTDGYGIDARGRKLCFACCADDDRFYATRDGRWTGYLTCRPDASTGRQRWTVSNWPGSLVFQVESRREGSHNIGRTRHDAWYTGPDGYVWHAVNIGDNDIARCRRTARKAVAS